MNTIYGYMDDIELHLAIAESVADERLSKLNYEFERVMMKHEQNLLAIDQKILMESGTVEDMELLYTIEAEETKQQNKGILGKIISAVKAFFHKLKEILFKKKPEKEQLPEKIEVPEDPNALMKEGHGLLGAIQGFFGGNKGALHTVGSLAAAAGAVFLTKDKVIPAVQNLNQFVTDSEKALVEAEQREGDGTPEEQAQVKGALNKLKAIGGRVSNIMKAIGSKEYKNYKDEQKIDKLTATGQQAEKDIQSLIERNKKIDEEIEELKKKKAELEKNYGNEKNFLTRNTNARSRRRLQQLQKKIDAKKELSAKEREEYRFLNQKVNLNDTTMKSEMSRAEAKIAALMREKEKNVAVIKDAGRVSTDTSKKAGKVATRRAQRGGESRMSAEQLGKKKTDIPSPPEETATEESVDDLILRSNVEIDYFLNSLQ